ncbi:sugar transferase [Microvirga terricola]|uniref:Sugar transferase n=1 Tax=Microvirga terricola TaxID=2719797 RepID=A0ABX0V781_9HYPH|nr:sugar transferase [Microvirga terricola]NIX75699.1 sugar transferase [Microvirga terricola]
MEPEQATRGTFYSEVAFRRPSLKTSPRYGNEDFRASPALRARVRVRRVAPPKRLAGRALQAVAKRCFDLAVAAFLIIFLAPALLAIAAAIKLTSRGPVLFRQRRYGLGKKQFEILKFRTMSMNSCDPDGVLQTRPGDTRVTSFGRFLRRTSLDELPQLFNVLRGDMSLVGPRPHVPGMFAGGVLYEDLVPEYFERLRVRPGVTGLAQVNGLRGSTEDPSVARARIRDDLAYIDHWSLALDVRILIMTARTEFLSGSGF